MYDTNQSRILRQSGFCETSGVYHQVQNPRQSDSRRLGVVLQSDTPAHVNELVEIINSETNATEDDMHVHYVTEKESIRHAHFTMVQTVEDVKKVRDNFNKYTIL